MQAAHPAQAAGARRIAPAPRPREPPPPRPPLFAWAAPGPALESLASAPWALPAVLGLGLLLRLGHLIALGNSPFADALVLDARYYDAWAQEISHGAVIGKAPFWVDPLYAYVLGFVYAIGGHHFLLARLLNLTFGLVTAVLIARVAERIWRSRAVGLLAALLAVTCIPPLYFEGQLEKTALTVVLITAAVALFLGGSERAIAAAGVVTGLASLARGNVLGFVPVAAAALLLGWDRAEPTAPAERRRRAGLFLAGALPIVFLATLHNWLATRELVPTTTNLGVNLYLGNHAGNVYGYYEAPDFLHPDTGSELPDFHAEARRRVGHPLSDAQLSGYWRDQAWDAIKAAPGLAIARTMRKLRLTLHNDELPDNEDVTMVGEWSPVLRLPVFWLGQLLPLAILGTVIGWPRRGVRVLAVMSALYLASLLPFFVMARLRVQVAPLFAILGAGAVVWLVDAFRIRDWRRLAAAAAICVPIVLIAFQRPEWMAKRRTGSLAIAWNNLGATLVQANKRDDAVRAFERAVAIDDRAVPASLRTLGDLYRERGDYPRAEKAMRRVVELKPESRTGREALRSLYTAMLADPRWRDDPTIRARAQALSQQPLPAPAAVADPIRAALTQARTLGSQGRTDEAIRVLQEAVRTLPYDEGLHYTLGETMERHGSPDEMIRFFSDPAEVARDQKPQTSHYFWAVGLARKGDLDGAISQLQKALEIDPAHEMSQREWGILLEKQGKPKEALGHFVEATKIHPGFRAAYEDAARVSTQLGQTADAESYKRQAASADPNTIRRFVYWARYLHEHGKNEAAWAEIQRMLRERPTDPEALKLRDDIRTALGGKVPAEPPPPPAAAAAAPKPPLGPYELTANGRTAVVGRLTSESAGAAWISYDARDAAAEKLATSLAAAFTEARWNVRSIGPVQFPVKPGLFLLVAEEATPRTQAVSDALERAGLTHTVGTAYRDYSAERRRADPSWQGPDFSAGQEFVLVVGRRPTP